MPVLKAITLYYDPGNSAWYIYSKEKIFTRHIVYYWGAQRKPVSINVLNGFISPRRAVTMKAMVTAGTQPTLGPLIGILSAENKDGSLKGNFNNYKAIMEAGQKIGGIVFAFTPSSVDWQKRMVYGKIFDNNVKRWVTCLFPFPNVVYNRIQDRAHESKENSQSCIQRFLAHSGITLYNRGFFNKDEIIKVLSKAPEVNKHIPETSVLRSKDDLMNMLERHQALYLKPTNDRLGSGIIRVIKSHSGRPYKMQYYAYDKILMKYKTYSIHQLWNEIRQQMISSSYIVQQAITLAVVSARPFDCRVLVQKNHRGFWRVSGLGIRIAAHSQSITTHVPRGGCIGAPKDVLQEAFPQRNATHLVKSVERLCIAAAKRLEQHYHLLGEMSIDVGLDHNGWPWIFEANAKPMRFDEPEIREKQIGQVIWYAQFLTFKKR